MKESLLSNLQKKNLASRYELYSQYFEYVERIREIENPSISIVIISWRYHENTILNLKMLEQQRHHHFELIFVDNGGTEEEFAPLKSFIDTYIRLNTNTGAYLARNIGAVYSKAPILLFLEDDGIADLDLVESHLLTHKIFDVISVRGSDLPVTGLKIGEKSPHYYLGNHFFPHFANLEGNASFRSEAFFAVGGWDDEIRFGHGGIELSIRLTDLEPDKRKQIYSPISVIYHDLLKDPEKVEAKLKRQEESLMRLKRKHPYWDEYLASWRKYYRDERYLLYRTDDFNELKEFIVRCKQIERRIAVYIANNLRGEFLYSNDAAKLNEIRIATEMTNRPVSIFGAGGLGKMLSERLRQENIHVACFYDNEPGKWETSVNDIMIKDPSNITNREFIIIASLWHDEISLQLEEKGLMKSKDFLIYML